MGTHHAGDAHGTIRKGFHLFPGADEFLIYISHHFSQQTFQRHQPHKLTVFIQNKGFLGPVFPQTGHQHLYRLHFHHAWHLPQHGTEMRQNSLFRISGYHIFNMQHANDRFTVPFIHGNMGMRPICDHIQNIFLCGIHIQANKLKTGNHNLFHRSFRQGQSAVQPFMLIFLQHPALVAFIQQHINLLLGVDVLMAARWEPEQFKKQQTASIKKVNEPCEESQCPSHGIISIQGRLLGKLKSQGFGHQFSKNYLKNRQAYQHNKSGCRIGHYGVHPTKPLKQREQIGGQFNLSVCAQNQTGNGNAELASRNVAVQLFCIFQNLKQMNSHPAAVLRHFPDHVAAYAHCGEFCCNIKGVDQNQKKNNESDKKNHVWQGCP